MYIRAERMQLSGTNTSGETVSVVSMRCRRVAIVADALGRAIEDVRAMRGLLSPLAIEFCDPCRDLRIARHSPVAAGRKAHGSHLRTIGDAGSLELVRKEAAIEELQGCADTLR